jgi:hypothetical protein
MRKLLLKVLSQESTQDLHLSFLRRLSCPAPTDTLVL